MIVEVLVAKIASAGAAASSRRNKSRLSSSRSGPFSCTNCARATASSSEGTKRRRSSEAPGARPTACIAGHCAATVSCRAASAPGAGSLAATSRPRARKAVAQLAPMTPVPTTATAGCPIRSSLHSNVLPSCEAFLLKWKRIQDGNCIYGMLEGDVAAAFGLKHSPGLVRGGDF